MAHSHSSSERLSDTGPQPLVNPDELRRHQRALRILIVVLIPLAIWTLVGLVAFWPGDISRHVNADVAGFNVPGITYPTARITGIEEISCEGLSGSTPGVTNARCADLTSQLLEGDDKGKAVTVPVTAAIYSSGIKVGQAIKLVRVPPSGDQPAQYQFSDFKRSTPLLVVGLIFAAVVIVVARWRGFAALIGLGFAGLILVTFMFPALIAGSNPIMVGLIGSSAIMFVALYVAHGFSARTTTALVGTLFGLILIALLGYVATKWSHLTGLAADDDYLLAAAAPDLQLTSVVICGMIVAGLGILNDVTITQASAVWELADQGATQKHLFSRAMRIGRDHIASTVYTIAFATAGASLGVFLLIEINNLPLLDMLQTERFAAEVLSIMVGSIGLVLAVPLTTAVGVAVVRASGIGRRPVRQPGTTPVRTRGAAAVNEPALPKQPERGTQEIPHRRYCSRTRRRLPTCRARAGRPSRARYRSRWRIRLPNCCAPAGRSSRPHRMEASRPLPRARPSGAAHAAILTTISVTSATCTSPATASRGRLDPAAGARSNLPAP